MTMDAPYLTLDAPYLTLRAALAANRLDDFVRQEEAPAASSSAVDLILSAPWHFFWCNAVYTERTSD